jgi:tRNA-2-methylthio-N6-dimethylallyladenosine synthase
MNTKTYFIKVFGCQMNVAEAQAIEARYLREGWTKADKPEQADEVVIHTCSVRVSAENRVFGLINNLKIKNFKLKIKPRIIVTGCLLRLPHKELKRLMPTVDEFTPVDQLIDDLKIRIHQKGKHTGVPISNGCNNFCSYCVVPYSRGREKSRNFDDIVEEVERLTNDGFTEITLLGQNVNSYGKDFDKETQASIINSSVVENNEQKIIYPSENIFCLLVQRLHQIEGLKKISFLTSNPWDFTDDIIRLLTLPKIDRYLHLPVQSGSDRILKLMNRKYTAEDYLLLIKKIKKACPKIQLGTDIIVGFPGETEKDFQKTVELCKKVGFINSYTNQYSPRSGTLAYKLKDDVSHIEKARRWKILDSLINQKKATKKP